MYFKKGSYQHDDNTVTIVSSTVRPMRSPRGHKYITRVEMHCAGEVVADPSLTTALAKQDDLHTKMQEIEAAYGVDHEDAGFYRDDGDVTTHFLQESHPNNLTGVCVKYFHWTPGDQDEFCSIRSFRFCVYADFIDSFTNIFDWKDSIKIIGDGGQINQWRNMPNGVPVNRIVTPYSTQIHVHQGRAIGLNSYPLAPIPLATGINFLGHLKQVQLIGPSQYGKAGKYGLYTTMWRYVYVFPSPTVTIPLVI